jgi:ATP synthase protein I
MRYNFRLLQGVERSNTVFRRLSKPVRTVLQWQLLATAAIALVAARLAGIHGASSAAAGGAISIIAGLSAAFVASRSDAKSAGRVLVGALRAEAVKVGLAAFLLWLVLANYEKAVVAAFIGAFAVTMVIFSMAFFVREY